PRPLRRLARRSFHATMRGLERRYTDGRPASGTHSAPPRHPVAGPQMMTTAADKSDAHRAITPAIVARRWAVHRLDFDRADKTSSLRDDFRRAYMFWTLATLDFKLVSDFV